MSNQQTYLDQIEESLYSKGSPIARELCKGFSILSLADQVTFARSLIFSGCKDIQLHQLPINTISNSVERIRASRIMLLALCVGGGEPCWSSAVIDRMWSNVISTPNGQISDLLKALLILIQEVNYHLSEVLVSFILDVTYKGRMDLFLTRLPIYSQEDFSWILSEINRPLTTSQLYFLGFIVPRNYLSMSSLVLIILRNLVDDKLEYKYWQLLMSRLYSYWENDGLSVDLKNALNKWLEEGLPSPYEEDINDLIKM